MEHPSHRLNKWQGIDDFDSPGTWDILKLLPEAPDIVHCYDLHQGSFDLRVLPWLSHRLPTFLTLDDAWYLSGHCIHSVPFYSFECDRWKTGCGQCPDLTLPSAIRRDATAFNWEQKRRIFHQSRLHIATPSRWLMRKVEQSILAAGAEDLRVIPNGVDLSVFHPGNKEQARQELGLPQERKILLFTARRGSRNRWKDFSTMRDAVVKAAARLSLHGTVFVVLGGAGPEMREENVDISFVPYQSDRQTVARYYQAADVYLHAAFADTFPGAVAEAMACGTPVIATETGGIPELVSHGTTGFLVPPRDAGAMADRMEQLLADDALREKMATSAADVAEREFGLERQVSAYLRWYAEVCDGWNPAG
jgi:glycosyltransferase involved in cell wall biosynthesis